MTNPGERITGGPPEEIADAPRPTVPGPPPRRTAIGPDVRQPTAVRRLDGSIYCPFCSDVLDARSFYFSCGLGPALLECRHCGGVCVSLRSEWADMSVGWRVYFLGVSLFYALVVFGLGGAALYLTFRATGLRLDRTGFAVCGAVCSSLALLLQGYRVARSQQRTRQPVRQPFRAGLLDLETDCRMKFVALMILTILAVGLLRLCSIL
jgi:hypothetical protein